MSTEDSDPFMAFTTIFPLSMQFSTAMCSQLLPIQKRQAHPQKGNDSCGGQYRLWLQIVM